MQLVSLIIAVALAVSATDAFLLPLPETTENDIVNTLPVPTDTAFDVSLPKIADTRNLKLSCPGCPVQVHRKHSDGTANVKTDIPSHLELDFSIDHASGSDRLMLNGFELYPNSDPMRYTLGAKVLPDAPHHRPGQRQKRPGHKKHHETMSYSLGFGLRTQPLATSEDDNLELILVDLQIIEVGNVFVDGISNVEVKLIKTPKGGLMIGEIETTASETAQKTPMNQQQECTTILCKWRAVLMSQFARLRTHKHCGGHAGHAIGQVEGAHGQLGHHNMHHGHGHGHRASWGQLFKNIASHILLPIAVGIVAGVMASILGMMVGTAIVCLWRTFVRPTGTRRHHRHGHSCHKAAQHEAGADSEKSSLMASRQDEEMDAPPAYVEDGLVGGKKSGYEA